MENNNIMPEILENDLIKTGEKDWRVKLNKELIKRFYIVDCLKKNLNKSDFNAYCRRSSKLADIVLANVILENITAIYRKVGKDYICIWEK